ncbi:MAG: cell division protein FtsA [Candidatus Pacebacteria bacterium]|nr:cell division protein FtsA [Candidatus Paceibacterota bacterium]MBP9772423.1 cell division protein FtsA [Candidatus Paceibacterota bacterium]QQR76465.1 MAG: cell division protein FtsA [Candidatus Nomurabacteria bacterium]
MRNITAGLDVGTQTTRVVVCEKVQGEQNPRVIGLGSSPTRGMRHGYVVNQAHVSASVLRALKDAEKNSGVSIKRVTLGVGGVTLSCETSSGAAIISKADNEVTHLDVEKAMLESEEELTLANKKIVDNHPIGFRIDGKPVLGSPIGMKGIKLEVKTLFNTSLAQHLDLLIGAVSEAGVDIIDIVPSIVAAGVVHLGEKQKTAGCALVNIGSETTSLVVYEDNQPVTLAVFPIGGNDITNDIALGLKIPLEEAESIKTGSIMSNFPKRKLDDIIEARLGDMFELIDTHLKKIRRNGLLPAGAIFIGGSSQFTNLEEGARLSLKLPARLGIDPLVEISKGKIRDSVWSNAFGLAIIQKESSMAGSGGGAIANLKKFFRILGKQLLP